jgi:hypothetical protein
VVLHAKEETFKKRRLSDYTARAWPGELSLEELGMVLRAIGEGEPWAVES